MFMISIFIIISCASFLPASCRFVGFIPNHKYIPQHIPNNYLEMLTGKSETHLHRIDSETAFCGRNRVDIREITILELQKAFDSKHITSKELVQCYLKRIELMNPFLNAVLETNPHAVEIAEKLDLEREQGINHGPLHGIPVLLKDSMGTADGMENTAGSVALLGLKPIHDSEVVRKLRKAGAIILGKTNMSEFGNFRATDMPDGWSGRGGRTKNAYVRSAGASGSSSGSAVATASNMVTVALGGETDGSIIAPSELASLVGLKTTVGRVSTKGAIGISKTQDVIGPIARTVDDAAIVLNAISEHGIKNQCFLSQSGLEKCENTNKSFKIGVLRDPDWTTAPREQLLELEKILAKLHHVGFKVIDPVATVSGTSTGLSRESETVVFQHEFKAGLNHYLADEVHRTSSNPIKNLADVIAFNIRHPPKEGYNQVNLIESEATDGLHNASYIAHRKRNKASVQTYIDFLMTKYDLDAIVAPTNDCNVCAYPAVAGYPHITMPAGFGRNGLPFGVSFYGMANSEETLLEIAYKLERVHKARRVSKFLD